MFPPGFLHVSCRYYFQNAPSNAKRYIPTFNSSFVAICPLSARDKTQESRRPKIFSKPITHCQVISLLRFLLNDYNLKYKNTKLL